MKKKEMAQKNTMEDYEKLFEDVEARRRYASGRLDVAKSCERGSRKGTKAASAEAKA